METLEKFFWNNEVTKNNLKYPNTQIIRFVKHSIPDVSKTILDFGCGAGRNSIALAGEGYSVIAIDCAEEAVEMLRRKAKDKNYNIKCLVNSNECQVPVENKSIDAIIADGSLFYKDFKGTIKLLMDLKNVLVKNGIMWADWRSNDDYLYGMGKKLEDDYFQMNEASGRLGARYHFFNKDTLENVYKQAGFEIVSVDKFEYTENNGKRKNSWYHVIAKNV